MSAAPQRDERGRAPAPHVGAASPLAAEAHLRPMRAADVGAVHAVEAAAYPFPWSRGNFIDSLAAGYTAWVLEDTPGRLLGYLLAMPGVDEMHLLNITVAPPEQGRGHGRTLLDALFAHARAERAAKCWLEVRTSNDRARAMYRHLGFVEIGVRKGYYPASLGRREDAIVMGLDLEPAPPGGADAVG